MSATPAGVDVETYRRLSEDIAAPIGLLTTRVGRWDLVTVIDSFLDVSYDPPTMALSLYSDSRAAEAVDERGTCALSVLSADQAHLAERYGEPGLPLQGMLQGVAHTRDVAGNALIDGALATFSLRVQAQHVAATHTLVIASITELSTGAGREPLVRFSKKWWGA